MRAFITRGVPVRMGLGKGTFYDMEYETNAAGSESHVVSKSRFYGTAVIHAHAAEQCGGKGMRIFLHRSLEEDLALIRHRLHPMRLRRPLKGVNYELDYLHEEGPVSEQRPVAVLFRNAVNVTSSEQPASFAIFLRNEFTLLSVTPARITAERIADGRRAAVAGRRSGDGLRGQDAGRARQARRHRGAPPRAR
jgi:hypothetical protein